MNYLSHVTDSALRRIYKFVLKRLIGRYLKDELVLEQLEVNSRKGIIRIEELYFDVNVLNEEIFSELPVKLVELSVNSISVALSYLNLMSESCVIVVDQIRVVVAGNHTRNDPPAKSNPTPNLQSESNVAEDISLAVEGESGLTFLAHWIETIINQLQIHINSLALVVIDENSGTQIELDASNIHYCNGDAQDFGVGVSSSQFASSLMQSSYLKSKFFLRSKKTLVVERVSAQVAPGITFFSSDHRINVSITTEQNRKDKQDLAEMDFRVPSCVFHFDSKSISLLIGLVSNFTQKPSEVRSAIPSKELIRPQHVKFDHEDELINQEINKIYSFSEPTASSLALSLPSMEEIVESDGEFPDNDDDSRGDEEFFDAVSRAKLNSTVFHSAYSWKEKSRKKGPLIRFRVYCGDIMVVLCNDLKRERMTVRMNDCILSTKDGTEDSGGSSIKLSVNDFSIFLKGEDEEIEVVRFIPEEDGNTIFSCPDLVIELSSNADLADISVTIKSFEILLDSDRLEHWVEWIASITTIDSSAKKPSTSAPVKTILRIQTKLCRCYYKLPIGMIDEELKEFISISNSSTRWKEKDAALLQDRSVGFFAEIHAFKLTTSDDTTDQHLSVHTNSLSCGIYLTLQNGKVKVSSIAECFTSPSTSLLTLVKSPGNQSRIVLHISKLRIVLSTLFLSLGNWSLTALAKGGTQTQNHVAQYIIEGQVVEYEIQFENSEEFSLSKLHFRESSKAYAVQCLEEQGVHKMEISWGPALLWRGLGLQLQAVVSSGKTEMNVFSKMLYIDESVDKTTSRILLQADSATGRAIELHLTLLQSKEITSAFSSNSHLRVCINECNVYIHSNSEVLLLLPNYFVPLKWYEVNDRFYRTLKENYTDKCRSAEDISALISTCAAELETSKSISIDALKINVELSNCSINLAGKLLGHSCFLHVQSFNILIAQYSNSKSFSLKCSCQALKLCYEDSKKSRWELLSIDSISVLVNSVSLENNGSFKQWVDVTFDNLRGRNRIRDILVAQDYLQIFFEDFNSTISKFTLNHQSSDQRNKTVVGRDAPWSDLFVSSNDMSQRESQQLHTPSLPQTMSFHPQDDSFSEESLNATLIWEPDYGSEDGSALMKSSFGPADSVKLQEKETESMLDALTSSMSEAYMNMNLSRDVEIELGSVHGNGIGEEELIGQVQPGLTETELAEIEEIDFAWRDDSAHNLETEGDYSFEPLNSSSRERDQQANWLVDPETVEINNFYLHNQNPSKRSIEFVNDENFSFGIRVGGNCAYVLTDFNCARSEPEVQIFKADNQSAASFLFREEVDISLNGVVVEFVQMVTDPELLESNEANQKLLNTRLTSKLQLSIQSFLVTHRTESRLKNYKVLGSWSNSSHPRGSSDHLLKLSVFGFNNGPTNSIEYRVKLDLSPIRCHLTEQFINFMKNNIVTVVNEHFQSTDSAVQPLAYFQHVFVGGVNIKIDYHPNSVNIKALHEGDYIQLLNIFPLDGLELHLKTIKLLGINGIAGTTPFKSISRIGSSIKGLLFIPMRENGKNPRAWKHVVKGTKSLFSAVTTEALSLTHQISLFLANTISDIASDRRYLESAGGQPRNLQEGLGRAVQSVSQEFSSSIEHIIAVPLRQYERHGSTGVVTSVIRALPVALLRPVAGVAQGLSYTILGLRNSLNPTQAMDEEDLWSSVEQNN